MAEILQFPEFNVPDVPKGKLFMLYGASNYRYYVNQVADAISGRCPFCVPPDEEKNKSVLENELWWVWDNIVAPRGGQNHQFVLVCKRHIFRFSELEPSEAIELLRIFKELDHIYQIKGSDIASRCAFDMSQAEEGDPHFALKTAQSIEHYHINYHVPIGSEEVEVTFAKSQEKLLKKREVLKVWEKMRQAEISGNADPVSILSDVEHQLVDKKFKPPTLASKA